MKRILVLLSLIFTASIVNAQHQDKDSSHQIKRQSLGNTKEIPFFNDPVEILPSFPGGYKKFRSYLSHNLHYPPVAVKHKIQGKVFVIFVVERDGRLTHLKVVKGISKELDTEALRAVGNSPNWIPGTRNGKPYRYKLDLPVNFSLSKK